MVISTPAGYPRGFDFLPVLSLQTSAHENIGEKHLDLYWAQVTVSVNEDTRPWDKIRTELGGTIKWQDRTRRVAVYEYGRTGEGPKEAVEAPISQKELLLDLENLSVVYHGNMPDVVVKNRGVMESIPSKLISENPTLEGSEYAFYEQYAFGNFPSEDGARLGFHLFNPFRMLKAEIIDRNLIRGEHSDFNKVMKKIRSTLVTEPFWTEEKGYDRIGPDAISAFEIETKKNRFWADFGTPIEYKGPFGLTGHVYKLGKRPDEVFFI